MKRKQEWEWFGNDGDSYYLRRLPVDGIGEKSAYELIRIDRFNVRRGEINLDVRYGRTVEDCSPPILPDAIATAPGNVRRILRRFEPTIRCECAEIIPAKGGCCGRMSESEAVIADYLPESERGTYEACQGNCNAPWQRLRLHPDCAAYLAEGPDAAEDWLHIVEKEQAA